MAGLSSTMTVKQAESIVNKHYDLLASQSLSYKEGDYENAERICLRDIKLYEQFAVAYVIYEAWFTRSDPKDIVLPRFSAFTTLAKIYEKQGRFDDAIEICQLAISHGVDDGTKGGFEGRIERLWKKKTKPPKQLATPEQIAKETQRKAEEQQNKLAVIESISEQIPLKVTQLNWYISVSFRKSTSDNFDTALFLAKNAMEYLETEVDGKMVYQAFYSSKPQDFLDYLRLYDIVKGWKSAFVMINGELVDRKIIQGINYCYGDKCRSQKSDFCFGASQYTQNPFGCHRLQISASNHPWWTYAVKTNNGYQIDKHSIAKRAEEYGAAYKLCPAYNEQAITQAIDDLPSTLSQWKYMSLCENGKLPGGSKTSSGGCLSTVISITLLFCIIIATLFGFCL